ncbi:unnamed protein product, partial [marine sediment metagenome]
LIKTDQDGNVSWTKNYGGEHSDMGYSVQETSDGGFIISGSVGGNGGDVYLIKTDENGDTLWTKRYGGIHPFELEEGNSVQETSDGGYIIAGWKWGSSSRGYHSDAYLIKTDEDGSALWIKTYGGIGNECAYSIKQTSNGEYIFSGYSYSFGVGFSDVYLVKIDLSGDALWTKTCGGPDIDGSYSVNKTSDGGCIAVGYTYSFGAGSADVYLLKIKVIWNY